jgi:hypothetical protein
VHALVITLSFASLFGWICLVHYVSRPLDPEPGDTAPVPDGEHREPPGMTLAA